MLDLAQDLVEESAAIAAAVVREDLLSFYALVEIPGPSPLPKARCSLFALLSENL